ncbi:hypothetical protein DFH11DRAFT_187741 [Phellopilus nigrolimitatus]|nr:hypothetical protein DFH11DRAFT_187741 [Phellopilus nigrolimitatus]
MTPTLTIQHLPPEVLREIFLACLKREFNRLSIRQAPSNVSQTCRYWRNVALSTGKLWSFLYYSEEDIPLRVFVVVLNAWLRRSGSSPLHYSIRMPVSRDNLDEKEQIVFEQIVTAMFQHQNRWRNIDLSCYGIKPSEGYCAKATSMPQIECLRLHFPGDYVDEAFKLDLSSALDIRELSLRRAYISKPISIHLTNLKSCGIYHDAMPEDFSLADACLEVLHAAPNLEAFEVEVIQSDSPSTWPTTPRMLLRHLLEMYMIESPDITLILSNLTAPALTSLVIDSEHDDAGPVLLDFIRRSQPPLTHLNVANGFTSEEYLLEALQLLPTLLSVDILVSSLSARFLEVFSVREGQSAADALCPSLRRIAFGDLAGWEGLEDLVAQMLLSRWTTLGKFEEFVFAELDCDMEEVIGMESVHRCIGEGLSVHPY